jgi:hypothetical protein
MFKKFCFTKKYERMEDALYEHLRKFLRHMLQKTKPRENM